MDLVSQKLPKIIQNYYNDPDTIRVNEQTLGRSEEAGILIVTVVPPALLVVAAVVAIILLVVFLFEYFLFVILFVGHNC